MAEEQQRVWCATCQEYVPDLREHHAPANRGGALHRPPTIWGRTNNFLREVLGEQGGAFGIARTESGAWLVSCEFGQEAPDSPMAAGALYGCDEDLEKALDQALRDARY